MQVLFGTSFVNQAKNKLTWYLSVPTEMTRKFGDRVLLTSDGVNISVEFNKQGKKLCTSGTAKTANSTFMGSLAVVLGIPCKKQVWWIGTKQVSTNPVVLQFPVPNLEGVVQEPLSAQQSSFYYQTVASGSGSESSADISYLLIKTATLLNEYCRRAGPMFKAYIRSDGTVWVHETIEKDI